LKTLTFIAFALCFGFGAKAQTVTVPIRLEAVIPLQQGSNTTIVTNITYVTNVYTNVPIPLEQLTSPIIDAQHKNRRLYGILAAPIILSVTNFDHGNRVEILIDNPRLMPITWPVGRWNGPMVSPTNQFVRFLIDQVAGNLEFTQ